MTSLADIGPLQKEVKIRGTALNVRGVNVHEIFGLLEQFPALKSVIAQRAMTGDLVVSIIEGIPAAIGAIIAAACGEADNPKAIIAAQQLAVGEQAELLEAIAEMTFPKGVRSFVTGLERLISQASGDRGWAAATNSRAQSNDALATDTDQQKSGDTPQGNLPDGAALSTGKEPAKT